MKWTDVVDDSDDVGDDNLSCYSFDILVDDDWLVFSASSSTVGTDWESDEATEWSNEAIWSSSSSSSSDGDDEDEDDGANPLADSASNYK